MMFSYYAQIREKRGSKSKRPAYILMLMKSEENLGLAVKRDRPEGALFLTAKNFNSWVLADRLFRDLSCYALFHI
jgi:hypothetical protein